MYEVCAIHSSKFDVVCYMSEHLEHTCRTLPMLRTSLQIIDLCLCSNYVDTLPETIRSESSHTVVDRTFSKILCCIRIENIHFKYYNIMYLYLNCQSFFSGFTTASVKIFD